MFYNRFSACNLELNISSKKYYYSNTTSIMKPIFFASLIFSYFLISYDDKRSIIEKGNVIYDFRFIEQALNYLETKDSIYIKNIASLDATEHIMNHAKQFNYDVPKDSKKNLVLSLLNPSTKKNISIDSIRANVEYAKKNVAESDLAQKICLQYLPENFQFSSSLYFTYGYDLGVAYNSNASINLAHPFYIKNKQEIKYYAIHELHHAGFLKIKNNVMPSLDIKNYSDMANLIEFCTHLEGMGTYAPLEIRRKDGAMNIDMDYIALQNKTLMDEYEKEYFEIYYHFKNSPEKPITNDDWNKLSILSDEKRLWYRVGAMMAETIDKTLGREKLTNLISGESENFIKTYISIKSKQN